jgi:predicted transcriptional regulator
MYLNYEILLNGYQTIYLGESIPIESLLDLKSAFEKITFVSYFTVEPNQEIIVDYIDELYNKLLKNTDNEMLILGRMASHISEKNKYQNIHIYNSIEELTSTYL